MYGHVEKLAEEIKKGAASVEGVEAKLWQACICVTKFTFPYAFHSYETLRQISNMTLMREHR